MGIESVGGSELLVEPVIKEFRYMFCFNNFVQEFDEQMLTMALALYRLQDAEQIIFILYTHTRSFSNK
ncbi:hypothetical protein SADUNF_Sadunf16G0287900 [Salix dunnii]|uniref:Uncharacterized protein n=1 Tax=Salix dunnii TaxID=1413687 RepID=A0A835JB01_9ROSI|nr:hypothetical protein SADUNF_Sadunf16G0287900 [Salix dunnii]